MGQGVVDTWDRGLGSSALITQLPPPPAGGGGIVLGKYSTNLDWLKLWNRGDFLQLLQPLWPAWVHTLAFLAL